MDNGHASGIDLKYGHELDSLEVENEGDEDIL